MTEFFVTLEKDPQQEDFLQGRMPGNPYSSNEPGIGPLMRDIKNKICQDCDLVALLEDDSGMEVKCVFQLLHFNFLSFSHRLLVSGRCAGNLNGAALFSAAPCEQ